jgi:hypothetical protein
MENDNQIPTAHQGLWRRMGGPLKIGLAFALIAIIMAVVGLVRGSDTAPLSVRSVVMAVVISGGTWGLISWAIATAVVEVERDVANAEEQLEEEDDEK